MDYVVGVDPHRDSHALAVVHVLSGGVVLESTVAAGSDGYAQALKLVECMPLVGVRSRSKGQAPSVPA